MFIPWYGLLIIAAAFLWALTRREDKDDELHEQVDDLETRIEHLENQD